MNRKPKLLVVGSLVMDLIVSSSVFPDAGETVVGTAFSTAPGGKGANQAAQAARLGADVTLVGMVGSDDFGRQLRESAAASGVDVTHLLSTDNASSAVGNVQICKNEHSTENRIIVIPGANHVLSIEDVAFLEKQISQYDMVLLQLEVDMAVNCYVAALAKESGVPVMLNPAPYDKIPQELLHCLTYICPNEHEAKGITGVAPEGEAGIAAAAEALLTLGVPNVLITLGKEGCFYDNGTTRCHCGCAKGIASVDPTAAGDSFIGAFCTATAIGIPPAEAMRFANCTAGITVSRAGAQPSLPVLDEVLALMQTQGYDTVLYEILKGGN